MTISSALTQFHIQNNLPQNGGENDNFFYLRFKLFSLKFPNPSFRKKVLHIHDIEHILYDCDTSWKGESFIAGWEIATGMWKVFPIGLFSLNAMGFGLFLFPKEVYKGYKTGLQCNGILNLDMEKEKLLNLEVAELKKRIQKKKKVEMTWFRKSVYLLWMIVSSISFLFPAILIVAILLFIL